MGQKPSSGWAAAKIFAGLLLLFTIGACEADTTTTTPTGEGLRIGSLLPSTGDLASVGTPIAEVVPLLVETVNACGGVNGQPVTLIAADDQSNPASGAEAMTKLVEIDRVAGVVGSFGSSVSNAAADIATRGQVMLISPGSTSTLLTERAKKGDFNGYWARTAPPDNYQAQALAQLAKEQGYQRVATVVINNDYGRSFEQEFTRAFKALGGTVINEDRPTRYDERATTFTTEAAAAFSGNPDAVVAILYPETGSLLLKSAFEQGLTQNVAILLTDGVKSESFPEQVGRTPDGKYIIAGAKGTVPGADGQALSRLRELWRAKKGSDLPAFGAQTWDAAALLVLAAQAAGQNTGEGIRSKLRDVANAPGEEVDDVCKGLALLREGKEINYQGASGNVDIDENGDVVGVYDIWQVTDDGKLKVIGQVNPQKP
ncbi:MULTISPECIES: ABC transporter substrate-binding protein [unclassified Thermosynechococcus]|uniref:ABC transporter substrate-binding protein n=1 Tax=unclassified Thermosynechococcus TaxID=2622553 RepID=UPI00198122EF|nr:MULTISPECIES: ABC transporter substrate-binding protein [unclassified Thermosynechococcus]MDR5639685.1 ABC transporter substrate-binding protein [Thermosynechococcus sp. PP42]MDR7898768.1 ABC transporter substrate-binding protein [Thermosynechococcus sp. JY1332]MDR7906172.1 ABC transporter substrate-binding protein [Thermosynechococcus sp. JY1334]MDR7921648.1 ABC transporter substrate-binding protein [Thermosynechococcus sp. HY213]MDR7993993.1 ABC transporter substrate-binding protein [Ther